MHTHWRLWRFWTCIALLLATLPLSVSAQVSKTLQSAVISPAGSGNGTVMNVAGLSVLGLGIIGSSGADRVVSFEGSQDGTNYLAISCTNLNSITGAQATTATVTSTTPQLWKCPVAGLIKFRAVLSGGTTGTATVTATGLQNVSMGGSSGVDSWIIHTALNTGVTVDTYYALGFSLSGNATETSVDQSVAPITMTCRNLRVQISNVPATTATWDVTLRTGAIGAIANTALTCQIPSAGTTCSNTTNTAVITAGNVSTFFLDASATVPASSGVGSFNMECYE